MSRKHLFTLVGVLAGIAGLLFLFKAFVLGFPLAPEAESEVWRIEARINFKARGEAVKATLQVPENSPGLTIVDQRFVSPGYGLATFSVSGENTAVFSIREASGEQAIYYQATVSRRQSTGRPAAPKTPELRPVRYQGAEMVAARAIVESAKRQSADIPTLVSLIIQVLRGPRSGDEAAVLTGPSPTSRRIARVATDLLQLSGIAARTVHGLSVHGQQRRASLIHWIEVADDDQWKPFEITQGRPEAPGNAVAWWRGPSPLIAAEGVDGLTTTFSVERAFEPALKTAVSNTRKIDRKLIDYSIQGLPIQTQAVYRILLVLPLGVLMLVLLRNVVGLKTFGTFMPVLVALAFRDTGILWGILLFSIILAAGLAIRFYLERLKLLLVPRVASVVIVVILLMVLLSILSHQLGFDRGLSISLFPIVILSMTIERMSIVWEERGPVEAFQQVTGSIAAAALVYIVMNFALVEHLFFVFPELVLGVLGLTLLMGRYTGYRLVELTRFKVLAGR